MRAAGQQLATRFEPRGHSSWCEGTGHESGCAWLGGEPCAASACDACRPQPPTNLATGWENWDSGPDTKKRVYVDLVPPTRNGGKRERRAAGMLGSIPSPGLAVPQALLEAVGMRAQ